MERDSSLAKYTTMGGDVIHQGRRPAVCVHRCSERQRRDQAHAGDIAAAADRQANTVNVE
jgi:hypothetical protein